MNDEIENILSKNIDNDLIADLVGSYKSVHKAYFNEDYEGTLSKSGKFVENVFRVLNYVTTKTKLTEIKQGQINDLFEKLEKVDSKKFSEIIRLVIPRVAITTYTLRSKMGSEHVKPTVPDFIDAKFTIASCDWIIAEFLRMSLDRDSSKVDEIIQKVKSTENPKLESFNIQLAYQIDKMSIPDLIMTILRTKSPQTKSEISATLAAIGKDISSWLKGGNLNNRLLKRGLVIKLGKTENNEDLLSLTIRGMIQAEKLIDEIKTQTVN